MPLATQKTTKKYILLMLTLLAITTTACNDEGSLGLDFFANGNQNVLFTDTISFATSTVREDSINISPKKFGATALQMLGSTNSDKFGVATAGFYAQIRLPTNDINFGAGATLDSVVLVLPYQNYYGDTTAPMQIKVYELDVPLNKNDSTTYTNTKLRIKPTPIATQTIQVRPRAGVRAIEPGKDTLQKLPAQIRIKLDAATAAQIFAQSGTSNLQNNDNFINYFKGIYVTATPQNQTNAGAIVFLNLLSGAAKTRLSVYYKTTTDTTRQRFDFEINSNSVRINNFTHNYTNSQAGQYMTQRNPANQEVYMASMAGLKTKIEFLNLNSFINNKKIAINKAELILRVIDQENLYPINSIVAAVGIDSTGKNTLLPLTAEQGGRYNDDPTEARPTRGNYTINITKYMQAMVQNPTKRAIYITPIGSTTNANRTVLGAPNNPTYAPRLLLTYTILD